MKTTLWIPILNEIEGLKMIMPKIKKEWCDQLIIIDGGSTDGSIEYAHKNGYFLINQKNKGIRNAYMEALEYTEGDVILTFSPDGNSIPELIPDLIEKMRQGYDMVIVSRYAKGAKSYDDDCVTAFGNWLFTGTINVLFGSKYTDAMVIFRAYRKELIRKLNLNKDSTYANEEALFHTKISWEPILSVRCARYKLKVSEIPGDEPARVGGERKLKVLKWGAAYLTQIIKERFIPPLPSSAS